MGSWRSTRKFLGALGCGVSLVATSWLPASASQPANGQSSAHVLRVGTWHGRHGTFSSIQAAVDAAKPGDWILIGPGDYHEQGDHQRPTDAKAGAAVLITTPGIHLRGMDRNRTVIDGTKPGAPRCSAASRDQDLGPLDTGGKPAGRNGVEVLKADGVTIDNLTVCNFLTGDGGGGNEIWWNGGDGSGTQHLAAFGGTYLSATSSYWAANGPSGEYGIFVSNTTGPGRIAHTYASNMADASYYVGACPDCRTVLDDAHAQYSALGYSGTNSGGHLIVEHSEFDENKTGFSTNSQNNDDAPSPQNGACPAGQKGLTGTSSCWVFIHNYVHDNNNPNVPSNGSAALGPPGTGMVISGGRNDTVVDNRFERNGSWAVLVVPFIDTGTPPSVAHCDGGTNDWMGQKGWCYFATWGNEIAGNSFKDNGKFANPTNGDLAELSELHNPGNCWHANTDPAGVTTAPVNLQTTNGTCGQPHAGAPVLGSPLSDQVICATEIFGPCPPAPGKNYPHATKVVLPALSVQRTMADPCAGVPTNRWCHHREPNERDDDSSARDTGGWVRGKAA